MQECVRSRGDGGEGRQTKPWPALLVLLVTACGDPAPRDTATGPAVQGACGEVTTHVIEVRARVEDAGGSAVGDVTLALEERNWSPGVRGQARSDASGLAVFQATEVVAVDRCWGTAVDYVLTARLNDGPSLVEDAVNPDVREAVEGDGLLDLTARPLRLP